MENYFLVYMLFLIPLSPTTSIDKFLPENLLPGIFQMLFFFQILLFILYLFIIILLEINFPSPHLTYQLSGFKLSTVGYNPLLSLFYCWIIPNLTTGKSFGLASVSFQCVGLMYLFLVFPYFPAPQDVPSWYCTFPALVFMKWLSSSSSILI